MKALIFAAGLGTRLKPITDRLPKALVTVDGRTLLDRTIERLIDAQASEIVVNVHHLGDQIVEFLAAKNYPVEVKISDERAKILDTGGGLKKAFTCFSDTDDPILVHNVDILHNADLTALYRASQRGQVTLMVSDRPTSRYLLFDENDRMCGWTNIKTGEVRTPYDHLDLTKMRRLAFSGIHCVKPEVVRMMDTMPEVFPIMDFYISRCNEIDIRAYVPQDLRLLDVGKIDSLSAAEAFVKTL